MRFNHSNVHHAVVPAHHQGSNLFAAGNNLSSLGTRTSHVPLNGNLGHIAQFQSSHLSGASKQETAVLRHANTAHNVANARDPVVMNILNRTRSSHPVSPQEQKFLAARLLANEKLLAADNAHKHPADVSYQLEVGPNGNSHVQEFIHGKPAFSAPGDTLIGRR
jgi:hypothetical protein